MSMNVAFVIVVAIYVVLLVIGNALGHTNPWNTTVADRVFRYPVEVAFGALGWTVMNAPLVAAAMIPLGLLFLAALVAWEIAQ